MSMAPTQLQPDGTFTFAGLSPGDYSLMAVAGNPLGGNIEFATASVTLAGTDLTGVQLSGTKPVSGKGRIVVDAEAAKSLPLAALNLVTIPADPEALPLNAIPTKINDDYSFELKVQPGKALIRLGGAPGAFAIRAVRYDGQDVTDAGIEFKPGEDVRDIEIELTNQAQQ